LTSTFARVDFAEKIVVSAWPSSRWSPPLRTWIYVEVWVAHAYAPVEVRGPRYLDWRVRTRECER
jgi:hypothetical protein